MSCYSSLLGLVQAADIAWNSSRHGQLDHLAGAGLRTPRDVDTVKLRHDSASSVGYRWGAGHCLLWCLHRDTVDLPVLASRKWHYYREKQNQYSHRVQTPRCLC